jgi:glutaredoxin
MAGKPPRVILYATRDCGHCRRLKAWLKQHRIPFREFDIQRNARAFREFQRHGGAGAPLLVVGDRVIRGFQPNHLAEQLRRAGVSL